MVDKPSTDQETAELAGLLKRGRASRGWTLRQAAAETGISNGYLSLIEHGTVKSPSPRYLRALADKYDLTFDHLMMLAGHPSGSGPTSSGWGRGSAASAAADRIAPDGDRDREVAADPAMGAINQDLNAPALGSDPGRVRGSHRQSAQSTEAAERQQLTALILEDVRVLSAADIAQVRAFIAGLRAASRR